MINVENGNVAKDKSIFIKDSLIAGIFPGTIKHLGVQSYDCTGKYIMPGLWDMHIHDAGDSSTRFEYIPLFLANGVTGVRDMWGSEDMLTLKKDINSGKFIGPRMIVGSPIIDGKIPFFIEALPAATEEQGRHYVDSLTDAGYDFIKIYSLVRKSVYLAIADECKKRGILLMGHLPIEIPAGNTGRSKKF